MRNTTHALIAAALLVSAACTVHDTSIPPVTGPSELATSLRLTATPSVVPQDGATQSKIIIQSFNATGGPVPNLVVQLGVSGAGSLSGSTVVTGSDGKATVAFVPPQQSGPPLTTTIHATPIVSGSSGDFTVSIQLLGDMPPIPTVPNSPVPTADFSFSPSSPLANQFVFFNATASQAAIGHSIAGYSWNFGDGTVDATSGVNASHQFALAGTYNVSLTVTDDARATATKTTSVTIVQGLPKASFTFAVTNAVSHTIAFDGGGSNAVPPFQIASWTWVFGDGTSGTGAVIAHSYAQAGNIQVTLTVTDSNGKTGTSTQIVAVP